MTDLARRALPLLAVVLPIIALGAILATAGDTLGYDYAAYVGAGHRVIDGQPLYDPAVELAGGFAVYLYPPPFATAMVTFALLPEGVGAWPWVGLLTLAFIVGVAVMPVGRDIRWVTLLLGGIEWPVLYGLKLGQVSVLLFLLFALAWRWTSNEGRLGVIAATGTILKLQPGLLIVWMSLTGRARGAVAALAIVGVVAVGTTLIVGVAAWFDYAALLGRVTAPVATPHNFTPGAIAYQLGVPDGTATLIQGGVMIATVVVVLIAVRWATDEASLLVSVVATQLLSPLLWDHYAVILLLPVAWLLQRRHWWAVAIPLALSLPLVNVTPAVTYPIAFVVCLVAPLVVGWRGSTEPASTPRIPTWVG